MAGNQACTFPTDIQSVQSFYLQASKSTTSIYSGLYLSFPNSTSGVAQLTTARGSGFWLSGTEQQMCERKGNLCSVVGGNEYCTAINLNSDGRAAVTTLENTGSSGEYWKSLTAAFYVDEAIDPLSLYVSNAGSYYACTSSSGNIEVYFRLNTTTAPQGCEDIVLNVELV